MRFPLLYRWRILSIADTFLAYTKKYQSPEVNLSWSLTFRALQTLEADVKEQHARLILLLIPHEIQLSQGAFDKTLRLHGLNPADYERAEPQRILKAFASQNQIPAVDLLDWFNSNEHYYLEDHVHFNEVGHVKTADALGKAFELLQQSPISASQTEVTAIKTP
jgi:hypothetical protein